MAEWSKAPACKVCAGYRIVGSNPTSSANFILYSPRLSQFADDATSRALGSQFCFASDPAGRCRRQRSRGMEIVTTVPRPS